MSDMNDNTPNIKAIETQYAGCRFRSRAEARWAVFFDRLGVEWRYEVEGYEISGDRYLPDFYLPSLRKPTWFEVKGKTASWDSPEIEKASQLAAGLGERVIIAAGDIPERINGTSRGSGWMVCIEPESGDIDYWWCVCAHCGEVGIEYMGRAARIGCGCYGPDEDKAYNEDDQRILNAFAAARSARFEFGESGAP